MLLSFSEFVWFNFKEKMLPISALSAGPSRELLRIDVFKIGFIFVLVLSFLATYLMPNGTGYNLLFGRSDSKHN